jgi:hypothetical protein
VLSDLTFIDGDTADFAYDSADRFCSISMSIQMPPMAYFLRPDDHPQSACEDVSYDDVLRATGIDERNTD